jgi:hypothetical protein
MAFDQEFWNFNIAEPLSVHFTILAPFRFITFMYKYEMSLGFTNVKCHNTVIVKSVE